MKTREIKRSEKPVQASKVVAGQFGEAALLTQEHISIYPGARADNSLQDNVFSDDDMGTETAPYVNIRYALIKVPKGTSVETVQNAITKAIKEGKKVRIYRILSNDVHDLLTDEQHTMLNLGRSKKTIEDYQNQYEMQDKNNVRYTDSMGQRQYRRNYFTTSGKADIDLRKLLVSEVAEEVHTVEATQEPVPDISRHQELVTS